MSRLSVAIIAAFLLATEMAKAADQALLVGVGTYRQSAANLPGIARDLEVMKKIALEAGFEADNIKILADEQATLANFRIEFQRRLKRRAGPDDRVLLYFSGHGTRVPDKNGDERDGSDEVLMMHDMRERYSRGIKTLENVLIDDELGEMLADLRSNRIVIVVDACHSGTVTKNFSAAADESPRFVPKSWHYEGMPEPVEMLDRSVSDTSVAYNYVALTAASDEQLAIATDDGSVFTTALAAVLSEDESAGRQMSLTALRDGIEREIWRNVAPEQAFTPQISGNTQRAGDPPIFAPLQ